MNLSPLRTLKALYSLAVLVRDPNQLPKVFSMADALSTPKLLGPMVEAVARDPQGARALADRPRVRIDLAELRTLPDHTLGRAFAEHMIANGLVPEAIPSLASTDDFSFLRAHLYETHDVWHVVTGFGTSWQAEIGLQAFYLAQLPAPLAGTLLAVGALRVAVYDMESRHAVMDEIARGWMMGKRARALFGVRWNDLWSLPVEDVRAKLGIVLEPRSEIVTARAA